jgi:hypothetical protein
LQKVDPGLVRNLAVVVDASMLSAVAVPFSST